MTANDLTKALMSAIPERFPATVWRSNRIDTMAVGRGGRKRRVKAGVDGQGDISGIVKVNVTTVTGVVIPAGLRVEIEVKAGRDRIRPSQMAFSFMIQTHGGMYIVARDVETALQEFDEFIRQF